MGVNIYTNRNLCKNETLTINHKKSLPPHTSGDSEQGHARDFDVVELKRLLLSFTALNAIVTNVKIAILKSSSPFMKPEVI